MKILRTAREATLQILFQRHFQMEKTSDELFNAFADNFTFDNDTREYAQYLVNSILEHEESINNTISSLSENWRIDRIALIDKILLQIAVFELKISQQTPTAPKLCITDILDLAKKYSSEDSKNFINGILDQVYQEDLSS